MVLCQLIGTLVFSASYDHTLRVWSLGPDGVPPRVHSLHGSVISRSLVVKWDALPSAAAVTPAPASPAALATPLPRCTHVIVGCCTDGALRMYNGSTGEELMQVCNRRQLHLCGGTHAPERHTHRLGYRSVTTGGAHLSTPTNYRDTLGTCCVCLLFLVGHRCSQRRHTVHRAVRGHATVYHGKQRRRVWHLGSSALKRRYEHGSLAPCFTLACACTLCAAALLLQFSVTAALLLRLGYCSSVTAAFCYCGSVTAAFCHWFRPAVRIMGCVVWIFGCLVVWLLACLLACLLTRLCAPPRTGVWGISLVRLAVLRGHSRWVSAVCMDNYRALTASLEGLRLWTFGEDSDCDGAFPATVLPWQTGVKPVHMQTAGACESR